MVIHIGMIAVHPRHRAHAKRREKLLFVQHVPKHPLQTFAGRNREQPVRVTCHAAYFSHRRVAEDVFPVLKKPMKAFVKAWQRFNHILFEHFAARTSGMMPTIDRTRRGIAVPPACNRS